MLKMTMKWPEAKFPWNIWYYCGQRKTNFVQKVVIFVFLKTFLPLYWCFFPQIFLASGSYHTVSHLNTHQNVLKSMTCCCNTHVLLLEQIVLHIVLAAIGTITIYRIFKKIVCVIFSCSYCTPSRSRIILASRRRTHRNEWMQSPY